MTSHEKLVEAYEDALFALMMDEMAQSEGARLIAESRALNASDAAAVPPELHKRSLQTIRGGLVRKGAVSSIRCAGKLLGRLAAAVLITVALFTAAFAASPAFRAGTLHLLMEIDEDLVQWSFADENASSIGSWTVVPTWLPDGYKITDEIHEPSTISLTYKNSANDCVYITLFTINPESVMQVDKEDADDWSEATVNGDSAVIVTKNGHTLISWANEDLSVFVSLDSDALTASTLLEIARNIKIS